MQINIDKPMSFDSGLLSDLTRNEKKKKIKQTNH